MRSISRWCAGFLLVFAPQAALAQTPPATGAASTRFEIEAYGSFGRLPDSGEATLSLPASGAPITTSSPLFPSRRVSSWLFGDGAALLNGVNQDLGIAARISPLDSVLATIGRSEQSGAGYGGRLRIRTSSHAWAEIAVDVTGTSTTVPASLQSSVQQTADSFRQAMTALFASGPFSGTSVTAVSSFPSAHWRDVTTTLGANFELSSVAGFTPFLTIGGGVVTRIGQQPAVTIEARYKTKILGVVPIDEADLVTVRAFANTAAVAMGGAGLTRLFGEHVHLRLDGRLLAANRTMGSNLDATPTVTTGTPADFIESFTNPSVQFSNNASTGRRSSLSGDALDHVEVTRSTRLQAHGLVTLGLAIRF